MGRGDKRTKKGKTFRGSSGKTRKSPKQLRQAVKAKNQAKTKSQ